MLSISQHAQAWKSIFMVAFSLGVTLHEVGRCLEGTEETAQYEGNRR